MFELDIQKGKITSSMITIFMSHWHHVIIFVKVPLKVRNWLTTSNVECYIVSLKWLCDLFWTFYWNKYRGGKVTLTSCCQCDLTLKRCNFKIKPQICISTWVLLNIKCFGCPWIFFWGIHGWHDVSVTCCQHEIVSKGCFKLNHLLVHVSIHNNNWSKCLLKLKRPIWKIWCQCDALYQKFANCPIA